MTTNSTPDTSTATRRDAGTDAEPRSETDPEGRDDADSTPPNDADSTPPNDADSTPPNDADSTSIADRLRTLGRVIWATFLASIVVFALIPAVALWFGAVPFDPPTATPYFGLVAFALVGTAVLVAGAVYDV